MKRTILLATGNAGKVKEFQGLLGSDFTVSHPFDPPHVLEDGETYFENALKKALAFHRKFKVPVLSDDSGLEVDVLNGAPGIYSARFGGENISWPERWKFLFDKLSPFPKTAWTARFRAVLCYYDGKNVPLFFQGVTEGRIHPEAKGGKGFGYDPIFFSTPLAKTFGEADAAEKDRVSHRAFAAKSFLAWQQET